MVDRLEEEYDVETEWKAFELHPETPAEGKRLPEHLRSRFEGTFERLKKRAQAHGMEMVSPDVMSNSRRALEAAEYAREQGRHEAFHRAVFHKYFGEGEDIGRWDVLHAAAEEVGLDAGAMQDAVESGKYQAAVEEQIAEAHQLGITGVPTYIFNDKYAVVGAHPYEVFEDVMEKLASETSG